MKKLLLIVDMQNDFMQKNGALYVKDADKIIDPTNNFLKSISEKDFDAVLITKDTHNPEVYDSSEEAKLFQPHCLKDTHGHELAINLDNIDKKIPIYFMEKTVFNMWQEDNPILKSNISIKPNDFFKDIKTAYVIGVTSDFCVKDAIIGLLKKGITVKWIDELSKEISTPSIDVAKQLNHKNLSLLTIAKFKERVYS